VIRSISSDGLKLTFDPSVDTSGTVIGLNEDEAIGLIRKYDGDWSVSVDDVNSDPKDLIPFS
jgi:hypothetical protein